MPRELGLPQIFQIFWLFGSACANVDTDRIRLLGRWRSDEMLRYLHVQAVPVVAPIAGAMLRNGQFTLLPNQPLHAP